MKKIKARTPFNPEKKSANLFTVDHPRYSETLYEIPASIVSGTMRVIQFHEELSIIIINQCTDAEKSTVKPNIPEGILQIAFCLSGDNITLKVPRINSTFIIEKGESLFGSPGAGFEIEFPENQSCHGISVHTTAGFLSRFIEPDKVSMNPEFLAFMRNPEKSGFYNTERMTSAIELVLHQILNCPSGDPLKHIFLESKVLELITLRLGQMKVYEKPPVLYVLSSEDKKRIRLARDIITEHMDDPPSLAGLAKQVCLDINRLKFGFRELFGTTVFAYLREERMYRARLLLEEGDCNVTETAHLVGYDNLSHFTHIFKNKFGINPGALLKKSRV